MNLILTSDFPATPIAEVAARMRAAAPSPRMAWVAPQTAASDLDFAAARTHFAALGLEQLECVDIDEDRDEVQIAYLHEFDVIYLCAGDPVRFRYNAIRSGLAGRLRQCLSAGRLIVAASAGALLLTPNVSLLRLTDDPVADVLATRGRYDALAAVEFELLPHVNRADAALLAKVAEYSRHVDHDIVCLPDGAALLYDDTRVGESIGEITRYRNGHIIES